VDTAEGARVCDEDGRHNAGDTQRALEVRQLEWLHPTHGEEVGVDEDEGHRVAQAAPARGERAGARDILGGEAGDDITQDLVGEVADVVDVVAGGARPCRANGGEGCVGGDGRVGEGLVREIERTGRQIVRVPATLKVLERSHGIHDPRVHALVGGVENGARRRGFCAAKRSEEPRLKKSGGAVFLLPCS
jgi:hypothetical protein